MGGRSITFAIICWLEASHRFCPISRGGDFTVKNTRRWESFKVTSGYGRIIFSIKDSCSPLQSVPLISQEPDIVAGTPNHGEQMSRQVSTPLSSGSIHNVSGFRHALQSSEVHTQYLTEMTTYESCKTSAPSYFPRLHFSSLLLTQVGAPNFIKRGG